MDKLAKIFNIRQICDLEEDEIRHNLMPHLHDFYSIFWIETGEATHATEFVEYSLKRDTILFVPPGLKHRMYIDKSVNGIYILFNEPFIQYNQINALPLTEYRLFNNPNFKSLISLSDEDKKKFKNITRLLLNEYAKPDAYSENLILHLLHFFLLESMRIFDHQNPLQDQTLPNTSGSPDATIIQFKRLVETNYLTTKNVASYAEMLKMNPSCLNDLSKRTTGITAGELIRNRIIEESRKLLFSSNMSGKEIAYELGFDDPSYFSRFFKKYTGTTLKEFRTISRKINGD